MLAYVGAFSLGIWALAVGVRAHLGSTRSFKAAQADPAAWLASRLGDEAGDNGSHVVMSAFVRFKDKPFLNGPYSVVYISRPRIVVEGRVSWRLKSFCVVLDRSDVAYLANDSGTISRSAAGLVARTRPAAWLVDALLVHGWILPPPPAGGA